MCLYINLITNILKWEKTTEYFSLQIPQKQGWDWDQEKHKER